MTDWLDDGTGPGDAAAELGEVRGLNAIAAHLLADGDFLAAAEVSGEVLGEMAGLRRQPAAVGPPDTFLWQFERLRALTCILSAELTLGHRGAVLAASRQFETACHDLDLAALATAVSGGPAQS
ncbi:MAG TPA: hypothetical protein VGI21_23315 [Streptosporangiaceae bacterium]|jgi:hypothetical protein